MKVELNIHEIRQGSTTTKLNDYRLTMEAVGTMKDCNDLMERIEMLFDKKKMKDFKRWEREKQT